MKPIYRIILNKIRIIKPIYQVLLTIFFTFITLNPLFSAKSHNNLTKGHNNSVTNANNLIKSHNNFIENKGQWAKEVKFLFKSDAYLAWITDFGVVYDYFTITSHNNSVTNENKIGKISGNVVKMRFKDANNDIKFEGIGESSEYYNYFIGNDKAKWATFVRKYEKVLVRNVYNGIDVKYYVDSSGLRYDFELNSGANPCEINFVLEGAEDIIVNKDKELEFFIDKSLYKHTELFAYQNISGTKHKVECNFAQISGESIGFVVGNYDKSEKLIIDPLIYSLIVGGVLEERAYSIATDRLGCVYFTGFTYSVEYPTVAGSYVRNKIDISSINTDIFVSKVNSSGSGLIFSTYIGGSGAEVGRYIRVDTSTNEVYISGETNSNSNILFPLVFSSGASSELTSYKNGYDVFLTKLSPSGAELDFSVLLGANNNDNSGGFGFILDNISGEVSKIVVSVQLSSTPVSLISPYVSPNAFQINHNGGETDCYIAVIDSLATNIDYATFLGGTGTDISKDLVVDKDNNILVTGNTTSNDFATTDSGYIKAYSGGGDVFVSKLNTELTDILYSTYIGGTRYDNVEGIDVDTLGNFYIAGHTLSGDFPSISLSQGLKNDSSNIFILKINPESSGLVYSTSITSNSENFATGIVVDNNSYAHISGYTTSTNYPTTWDAFIDVYSAHGDALYSVLDSAGSSLIFSSYIGGDQYEYAYGLALDTMTSAYICGATTSGDRFPHSKILSDSIWVRFDTAISQNVYERTLGSYECFIFKSIYKPYPGELATNIDIIGNMFCPGDELEITIFTPYGFYYPDNEFHIQLSDIEGNFSPTSAIIGTLQASKGGIVKITFPTNLNNSKKYRIRAISTHPRSIGYPNNIDLDISPPYIELDTNNFPKSVCSGALLEATISSNFCFDIDNIYSIELSDTNGTFNSPIILATNTGNGSFSSVITISDTLVPSIYKIRVTSSLPEVISNEIDFEISKPQIKLNNDENLKLQNICAGNNLNFGFNATKCFNIDNIFYLILSDTNGTFDVCDTIGKYIGNGADTMLFINTSISNDLNFSEKYKIKLISTSPELEQFLGVTDYNYTLGRPYIFTNNLTDLVLCRNIGLELDLNTNSCFEADNIFQIYIKSDTGLIKIGETVPNSKKIILLVDYNNYISQYTTIIVRSTNPVIQTTEIPINIMFPEVTISEHLPNELCSGMDFDLKYITNGCIIDTINVSVEMSINDNNFINPIIIGTGKIFNDSGKISCKLPDSIDFYKKYYIRTIDSAGFKSTTYLLNINPSNAKITSDISELEILCSGVNFYINFEVEGCFDLENIFKIILSDMNGEFNSNAKIIGELTSSKSGNIYVSIPLDIDTSNNYRIKIISTYPATENIFDFAITIKRPYILIDSFSNLLHCNPNPILSKSKNIFLNTDDSSYVSFISSDCFTENNYFILQFGKNGDFTNPINVDTCAWNEKEFYFMLPENMGTDTFRFRVISTNPIVTSDDNGFDVIYNQPFVALTGSNKPTICRNKLFKFNYQSSECFDSTNIFYLEMSDANGDFINPIILDFNSQIGNGTFNIIVPEDIPYDVIYKLRIRSTSPEGYFVQEQIIFSVSGPEILTGNLYRIRTARNDTLYVPFNCNCLETEDKVFVAQLSDPYGNFDNILEIGSRIGWQPNGKIYTRISLDASDGKGYRIRVVCKNPDIIGTTNGKDITIFGLIYLDVKDRNNLIPTINPAPFDNELTITTNGNYIKNLAIIDMLGKTRINFDYNSMFFENNSLVINTSELETGTFLLIIDTGTEIIRKIVLKVKY